MRFKLAVLGLCAACLLLGDDAAQQRVQVSKTEKVDFPAHGTLRLLNSTGDLTIEGWDEPGVEITTTKSGRTAQDFDRVQVSTKRNGDELTITTEYPHHRAFPYVSPLSTVTNFDLAYVIKVPRSAKIIVKHEDGEVYIDDVAGNIEATARQGVIQLRLVGDVPPAIDARSSLGSVYSDFTGSETTRPWPFGHKFMEGVSTAPQSLHLKIGYGDIVIQNAHEPKAPPPVT